MSSFYVDFFFALLSVLITTMVAFHIYTNLNRPTHRRHEDPSLYGFVSENFIERSCLNLNRRVHSVETIIKHISRTIGKDYQNLGRELGLTKAALDTIELDCKFGAQEEAYRALHLWMQNAGEQATKKTLVQALKQIQRMDIVEQIKKLPRENNNQNCNSRERPLETNEDTPNLLVDLQTQLKTLYEKIVLKGLPWMNDLKITLRDYYVELMMIQQNDSGVDQPEKPIHLNQLFTLSSELTRDKNRILIEGGPGYGKTTFGYKLCYDFALGVDYIRHFDLVLLLPLRDFSGDLNKMLAKVSGMQKRDWKGLLTVLENQSTKTLLIIEGFDELPVQHRPVINSLINGDCLDHVTVLVTSRPGLFGLENVSRKRHVFTSINVNIESNPFAKRIRITGIPETKIDEFANKHLANFPYKERKSAVKLLEELMEKDVLAKNFLQCPLFVIMVILLLTDPEYTALKNFNTKTELFKQIMNFVVGRYLMKCNRYSELPNLFLIDFAHKPFYVDLMVKFGLFSVEALKSDKLCFSHDSISRHYSTDSGIVDFGLLNKGIAIKGFREQTYYEPVHKSLLEFAAAYYLWIEFVTGPRDLWEKNVCCLRPKLGDQSSLVLHFLTGLLKEDAPVIFQTLKPYASEYAEEFCPILSSLLEIRITYSLLRSLLPYMQTEWVLPYNNGYDLFSCSSQHTEILNFGLKNWKIKQLYWVPNETPVSLPHEIKVDKVTIQAAKNFIAPSERQRKSITCTYLYCYFTDDCPSTVWHAFLSFILSISFHCLSFVFEGSSSSSFLPLLHSAMIVGCLKGVNIHKLVCDIAENIQLLDVILELIQKERIEGLWLTIGTSFYPDRVSALRKSRRSLFQKQVDRLVKCAAKSGALLQLVLDCDQEANATIDLVLLCNKGKKSWNFIRLKHVKIKSNDKFRNKELQIQQLSVSGSDLTGVSSQAVQPYRVTSFECNANYLASFFFGAHLTELHIVMKECYFFENLLVTLHQLSQLQVLALTMGRSDNKYFPCSVKDLLLQSISNLSLLKGIELYEMEVNFAFASELAMGIKEYLEESLLQQSVPKLHYIQLSCELNTENIKKDFIDDENCIAFISFISSMKQLLAAKALLQLDILSLDHFLLALPTTSQDESTSLSNVFSPSEGFRIESDFWGMREDDSLPAQHFCGFAPGWRNRVSISCVRKTQLNLE